jgi:hypothetical protein
MKTLKPGYFGHRRCLGKKAEAKEANRVSAKCAIAESKTHPPTCQLLKKVGKRVLFLTKKHHENLFCRRKIVFLKQKAHVGGKKKKREGPWRQFFLDFLCFIYNLLRFFFSLGGRWH